MTRDKNIILCQWILNETIFLFFVSHIGISGSNRVEGFLIYNLGYKIGVVCPISVEYLLW